MVKKKRQSEPYADDDDSTTESCDEKQASSPSTSSPGCPHLRRAVDLQKVRATLKTTHIELEKCSQCEKAGSSGSKTADSEELYDVDKSQWLCLRCGTQLCGRAKNQHALQHYKTPRSDCHALALNTTTLLIWCYQCDNEIAAASNKKLLECVEFVKKETQRQLIPNIKDKIMATIDNIQPLLGDTTFATKPATNSVPAVIPGMAKRVEEVEELPRVRGLSNLGNTCFFNAVMQCLSRTPYLLESLKELSEAGEEFELPGGNLKLDNTNEITLPVITGKLNAWGNITSILAETLESLQVSGSVFNPHKLFHNLTTKLPQFAGGGQHDSHELLRHLLESVRYEDLRRYQKVILANLGYKSEELKDFGDEMRQKCKFYGQQAGDRILKPEPVFRGFLVSTLTCQVCHHTSSRHESFLDISLPVSVEKPQPPIRRKGSPEPVTQQAAVTVSKLQAKKDKDRMGRRQKSNKKGTSSMSIDGNAGSDVDESKNTSSSSSCEQSDADVEDNLTDDAPKKDTNRGVDPNGNNETVKSPIVEKMDDTPENTNKDNDDDKTTSANELVAVGISQNRSANLVRQQSLSAAGDAASHLEQLSLKEKNSPRRTRTTSHTDWSTTIAPRYQCEDGECSVQSCLNNFTAIELMTGNNKVGCDECTEKINGKDGKTINTNATKQFLISSPPAVLILHLKRFQVGPRCMFRKLSKHVTFPFVLDIAPFCGSKVKKLPNINRNQKKLLYSLYGIVEHSGSMCGGHYTAFVKVRPKLAASDERWQFLPKGSKAELDQTDEQRARLDEAIAKDRARELRLQNNDSDDASSTSSSAEEPEGAIGGSDEPDVKPPPGKWYHVSDSRVQEISEESVLNAQAYMLFYERIY